MSNIKYKLPVASTDFFNSPEFQKRSRRECALICKFESENEREESQLTLVFEGVEAFKCSYFRAGNLEIIKEAYDKIIDCGDSDWLREVVDNLQPYELKIPALFHLAIYFDDGPCYEFICQNFVTNLEKNTNHLN